MLLARDVGSAALEWVQSARALAARTPLFPDTSQVPQPSRSDCHHTTTTHREGRPPSRRNCSTPHTSLAWISSPRSTNASSSLRNPKANSAPTSKPTSSSRASTTAPRRHQRRRLSPRSGPRAQRCRTAGRKGNTILRMRDTHSALSTVCRVSDGER